MNENYDNSIINSYCSIFYFKNTIFNNNNRSLINLLKSKIIINDLKFIENTNYEQPNECLICSNDMTKLYIDNTDFINNYGIMINNKISTLKINNSLFNQHTGSIAYLDVINTEQISFINNDITQSHTWNNDALIKIIGTTTTLKDATIIESNNNIVTLNNNCPIMNILIKMV